MVGAAHHRRVFLPVLGALVGLAWLALWAWARSPYGRYMDHGDWTASGPAAFLCRVVPAGDVVVPALLYGAAWILMTAAMMLPSTLPLFAAFDRLTAQRADHGRLLALLGLGYVAVWGAFGLLAHALHGVLLAWVDKVPALAWHSWLIGAAIIAVAGAFQFSKLKHRCLDKCRTPLSFAIEHWRGRAPAATGVPARCAPRAVLRRLLLGADAADVRGRRGQPGLDAAAGRGDGGRKEHADGGGA